MIRTSVLCFALVASVAMSTMAVEPSTGRPSTDALVAKGPVEHGLMLQPEPALELASAAGFVGTPDESPEPLQPVSIPKPSGFLVSMVVIFTLLGSWQLRKRN